MILADQNLSADEAAGPEKLVSAVRDVVRRSTAVAGERLATVRDTADYLNMPTLTVYDRARKNLLPGAVRIGRRVMFDMEVLRAWVKAGGDYGDRAEP